MNSQQAIDACSASVSRSMVDMFLFAASLPSEMEEFGHDRGHSVAAAVYTIVSAGAAVGMREVGEDLDSTDCLANRLNKVVNEWLAEKGLPHYGSWGGK